MGSSNDGETLQFDDVGFDREVLRATLPVLVEFWAPGSAPCRVAAPVVDKIARDFGCCLKVGRLNVNENTAVPSRYLVPRIPTLLVFRGGRVVERIDGTMPRGRLEAVLMRPLFGSACAAQTMVPSHDAARRSWAADPPRRPRSPQSLRRRARPRARSTAR